MSAEQTPAAKYPSRLPGSFWGITAYFNPVRYGNKLPNYRLFRESLKAQGLPLVTVELVHGDAPFELEKCDAEILVQRRGGDVMWQKERMLNIALEHVPDDCDKVAWLDADVLFQNRHWIADTADLLEQYEFVQPFSLCFRMGAGSKSVLDDPGLDHSARAGSAYCWSHRDGWYAGMPGMAMAARREILKGNNLYDRDILGANDRVILSAAMGLDAAYSSHVRSLPDGLVADARAWCSRIAAVSHGSLSYTEGNVFHLWHGAIANRGYSKRSRLLRDFNVHEDIRVDSSGAWAWATDKPALHARVYRYFQSRKEEGPGRLARLARWLASLGGR